MNLDLKLALFFSEQLRNPVFDFINVTLTQLGNYGIIWIVTAIVCLFFKKLRATGIGMLIALVLSYLLCHGAKFLINRLRPFQVYSKQLLIVPPGGSSFPSSHAATSMAPAFVYFMMARSRPASYFRWPIMILALLTAFSRIYLFVHYPSDVLAGTILGIVVGALVVFVIQKLEEKGKLNFLKTNAKTQSKKKPKL